MENLLMSVKETKTRGECFIKTSFMVWDDWQSKVGEKAIVAWHRLLTFVDRKHTQNQIRMSLKKVYTKLGMSRKTFYKKVLLPLYNFGLIDLKTVKIGGMEIINILVYSSPKNDPTLADKEIEKIRDYDEEYNSSSRDHGKKGSLKKQENQKAKAPRANLNGVKKADKTTPCNSERDQNTPRANLHPNNIKKNLKDFKINNNNNHIFDTIFKIYEKEFKDSMTTEQFEKLAKRILQRFTYVNDEGLHTYAMHAFTNEIESLEKKKKLPKFNVFKKSKTSQQANKTNRNGYSQHQKPKIPVIQNSTEEIRPVTDEEMEKLKQLAKEWDEPIDEMPQGFTADQLREIKELSACVEARAEIAATKMV